MDHECFRLFFQTSQEGSCSVVDMTDKKGTLVPVIHVGALGCRGTNLAAMLYKVSLSLKNVTVRFLFRLFGIWQMREITLGLPVQRFLTLGT